MDTKRDRTINPCNSTIQSFTFIIYFIIGTNSSPRMIRDDNRRSVQNAHDPLHLIQVINIPYKILDREIILSNKLK